MPKAGTVFLLVLAACSEAATAPSGTVVLEAQSSKPVYSLTTDAAADGFLINRGSRVIYAPMNEYVAVQRLDNGVWSLPRPWFAVDGATISFPVEPGDTLRAFPMAFGYVGREPGTYRFIFEVALDRHGHQLVPEPERVTAPFTLVP